MNRIAKLLLSIGIDAAGLAAYGLFDSADLIWAPVSAVGIALLYRRDFYTFLGFTEELLPGLDFIPTATLAWLDENGFLKMLHRK